MVRSLEPRLRQPENKSLLSHSKMTPKHVRSDSSTLFLVLALAMVVIGQDLCHYGLLCTRAYNTLFCFATENLVGVQVPTKDVHVRNLKHYL